MLTLTTADRPAIELRPNRATRRALRRQMRRQYRSSTRYWRRAWRGVIPQWQVIALAYSAKLNYENYPGASKSVRRVKGAERSARERHAIEELHAEARALTALITRVRQGVRVVRERRVRKGYENW